MDCAQSISQSYLPKYPLLIDKNLSIRTSLINLLLIGAELQLNIRLDIAIAIID